MLWILGGLKALCAVKSQHTCAMLAGPLLPLCGSRDSLMRMPRLAVIKNCLHV